MERVNFVRMEDGTAEEYALLERYEERRRTNYPVVDQVLTLLTDTGGPDMGYLVSRLEHSLQTATRAFRDEADEETVVAALLHDIGDMVAPDNHSEFAASVLRPYVSDKTYWIVKHHGIFQGYYFWHHLGKDRDARERFRGHEYFEATAHFCESWDQTAFDPNYDTMPLDAFKPMVNRIFAHEPFYCA